MTETRCYHQPLAIATQKSELYLEESKLCRKTDISPLGEIMGWTGKLAIKPVIEWPIQLPNNLD